MFEFRLIVLDLITNDDETFEAAGLWKYRYNLRLPSYNVCQRKQPNLEITLKTKITCTKCDPACQALAGASENIGLMIVLNVVGSSPNSSSLS